MYTYLHTGFRPSASKSKLNKSNSFTKSANDCPPNISAACKKAGFAPKLADRFCRYVSEKMKETSETMNREKLTEMLIVFSREERRANQEFYAMNLKTFDDTFDSFCFKKRIVDADKIRFKEYVEDKLQKNLWEKIGHWREADKKDSYLAGMLANLRKNALGTENGFFNPSTDAKRLGFLAVEMEKKLNMFKFSKSEALGALYCSSEYKTVFCEAYYHGIFPEVEKPPKKGIDFPVYATGRNGDAQTNDGRLSRNVTEEFLENLYERIKHKPLIKKEVSAGEREFSSDGFPDSQEDSAVSDERWELLRKYAQKHRLSNDLIVMFGFLAKGIESGKIETLLRKPAGWVVQELKAFYRTHQNKLNDDFE